MNKKYITNPRFNIKYKMMKKAVLLTFCIFSITILSWCDNYNNLTTYEDKTKWCEKRILSHWTAKAKFERKWTEKIWDKIEINWLKYEWKSKQEIKCEFNKNGKHLWIKSSTLTN